MFLCSKALRHDGYNNCLEIVQLTSVRANLAFVKCYTQFLPKRIFRIIKLQHYPKILITIDPFPSGKYLLELRVLSDEKSGFPQLIRVPSTLRCKFQKLPVYCSYVSYLVRVFLETSGECLFGNHKCVPFALYRCLFRVLLYVVS